MGVLVYHSQRVCRYRHLSGSKALKRFLRNKVGFGPADTYYRVKCRGFGVQSLGFRGPRRHLLQGQVSRVWGPESRVSGKLCTFWRSDMLLGFPLRTIISALGRSMLEISCRISSQPCFARMTIGAFRRPSFTTRRFEDQGSGV